uniref:Uncharacterized protein n=1 Tax=Romanomermis culicivorax TaxID=13658 RepID=A0A915KJ00_ROMCU
MLKATISAMWALDVSRLTLRFLAALRFFNNPSTSFLQSDIFAYAALDAYYPLLLFLAFSHYSFIPEVYNALFPHTHWMPPKSTTLPRQSLPPFTTLHCQMFYPPTLPIEYIPLYRKSPFP